MNTQKSVLIDAEFGSRIAEDEVDELHSYFVETEQWRKLLTGDVDIVFGAKGAGKSALYSLLVAQKEKLRLGRRTLFIAAENPRGTPAFRDLTTEPPLSEEQFRGLWKLYFLSIATNYIRYHLLATHNSIPEATEVIELLTENDLLPPNVTLLSRLKAVLEYLRNCLPSVEGGISDPNTGLTYTGKITMSEPSVAQRGIGYQSVDDLLLKLNSALQKENITIWLALDRLDVAFADSDELEGNALRSLFRTYLDMLSLSHLKLKIFLRSDIWRKIVKDGFREASHITRTITLSWDQQSLLNLIVRRLASNQHLCQFYGLNKDKILASTDLQSEFFYRVFPQQIDVGVNKPKTLDWMITRTTDGSKQSAPREFIHLLLASRDAQLRQYENGNPAPEPQRLFDKQALRSALTPVSKARYEQTLCAEFPTLKIYVERLEREKTEQSRETLSKLWKVPQDKASEIAERLVEVGFFERRGTKESPRYWVPFLYRDALNMVQGSA